jgi:hypothetical protein
LDDFDFGFQNSVSKRQIQQLAEMAWLEGAYNIIMLYMVLSFLLLP